VRPPLPHELPVPLEARQARVPRVQSGTGVAVVHLLVNPISA
jgi:hypothetical protein